MLFKKEKEQVVESPKSDPTPKNDDLFEMASILKEISQLIKDIYVIKNHYFLEVKTLSGGFTLMNKDHIVEIKDNGNDQVVVKTTHHIEIATNKEDIYRQLNRHKLRL